MEGTLETTHGGRTRPALRDVARRRPARQSRDGLHCTDGSQAWRFSPARAPWSTGPPRSLPTRAPPRSTSRSPTGRSGVFAHRRVPTVGAPLYTPSSTSSRRSPAPTRHRRGRPQRSGLRVRSGDRRVGAGDFATQHGGHPGPPLVVGGFAILTAAGDLDAIELSVRRPASGAAPSPTRPSAPSPRPATCRRHRRRDRARASAASRPIPPARWCDVVTPDEGSIQARVGLTVARSRRSRSS